ncbi:anaphase promoting complex subunit 5 [Ascosphaera pollenicola]|nr:anaphase promoting complex subunit 5 [Ascosphaera pollenicola]
MVYIGEILFSSSSQQDGLAWTRDAVDIAESTLLMLLEDDESSNKGSLQAQRAISSSLNHAPAPDRCRDCLKAGLDNWSLMVRQLVRQSEKKEYESIRKVRQSNFMNRRISPLFGSGPEKAMRREIMERRRWEAEQAILTDRTSRARWLLGDQGFETMGVSEILRLIVMSRYMTPSKIGLLCLVKIYAEDKISKAAVVPLLSLIMENLLPLESTSHASPLKADATANTLTEQAERLLRHASTSHSNQTVYELFLSEIWGLQCLDSLEEFVDNMSLYVHRTREELIYERDHHIPPERTRRLGRNFPLGAFIRKAQLEYSKLQFQEAAELWRGFMKFRMTTLQSMTSRQRKILSEFIDTDLLCVGPDLAKKLVNVAYGDLGDPQDNENILNGIDFERLFEFQVSQMQSNGSRLPDAMRNRFKHIIETGRRLPSNLSHYIKFLDSWRAGDYSSSFNHLHRYFDFTMQKRDRSFYQYALLNLAILQAEFNCHSEAVSAIQETISTARELHDMDCLNFAMSWLYHFSKTFPDDVQEVRETGMLGSEKENIAFLHAKARESESWSLLATSYLSEGKLMLQNLVSQGDFENALQLSKNLSCEGLPLKCQQHAHIFEGIAKFDYFLRQHNFTQCEHILDDLKESAVWRPDELLMISLREVDFLVRRGDFDAALDVIEQCGASTRQETFDVVMQVKLLNSKALVFEKLGLPERGFSLAMRAASVAFRSRFYPGLWEAIGLLSRVLMSFREFRAAVDILESITPQVLAYNNTELKARIFSLLGDGNMGLAGQAVSDRQLRDTFLEDTIDSIDESLILYEVLGDVHRQCEMMAKKAMALRALGDFARTEETATKYLDLRKKAQARTAAGRA